MGTSYIYIYMCIYIYIYVNIYMCVCSRIELKMSKTHTSNCNRQTSLLLCSWLVEQAHLLLGLGKAESHAGQKRLDLRSLLSMCPQFRSLLLTDSFPRASPCRFDHHGHEGPDLVDLFKGPGLAKHCDHGWQVPRLHPPDQMGLVSAMGYCHPRGPEEAGDHVHVWSLPLVDLLHHLLLSVGLGHIGNCPQGVRAGFQGQQFIPWGLLCP